MLSGVLTFLLLVICRRQTFPFPGLRFICPVLRQVWAPFALVCVCVHGTIVVAPPTRSSENGVHFHYHFREGRTYDQPQESVVVGTGYCLRLGWSWNDDHDLMMLIKYYDVCYGCVVWIVVVVAVAVLASFRCNSTNCAASCAWSVILHFQMLNYVSFDWFKGRPVHLVHLCGECFFFGRGWLVAYTLNCHSPEMRHGT